MNPVGSRSGRWLVVMVSCVVVVGACGSAEDTTVTVEDMVGRWTYGGYVQEFNEDGTYTVGSSDRGRYSLVEDVYTEVQDDDVSFCPGIEGTYTIRLTEEGELERTLIEDECSPRAGVVDGSLWVRTES